jgi:hypothetical protein
VSIQLGLLRPFLTVLLMLLISGCGNQAFNVRDLAKSDVDMVADIVIEDTRRQLMELMEKLYKRNPRQLAKTAGMTIEKRQWMIFDSSGPLLFDELQRQQEIDAMYLAFDETFKGDRVFALMTGLAGMIRQSYGYNEELFLNDDLDAQKLYNSARNIEVMAWKLKNQKLGEDMIITSTHNGVIDNISFERLYGKLIQKQDMMAMIIADRDSRAIKTVIHSGLSVFLPI